MEKSLKSNAINYGIYLGVILSTFTIIGYAISLGLFTQWWFGILMLVLIIALGTISAIKSRKLLGGFISFKNAFTSYFITILIGILISALVSILIFNFVDPDSAVELQELIVENQITMMERFGAPQEAIDQTLEKMQESGSMYSVGNIFKSLAFQLIGFSIVGLIVAAVVKRKDPELA